MLVYQRVNGGELLTTYPSNPPSNQPKVEIDTGRVDELSQEKSLIWLQIPWNTVSLIGILIMDYIYVYNYVFVPVCLVYVLIEKRETPGMIWHVDTWMYSVSPGLAFLSREGLLADEDLLTAGIGVLRKLLLHADASQVDPGQTLQVSRLRNQYW